MPAGGKEAFRAILARPLSGICHQSFESLRESIRKTNGCAEFWVGILSKIRPFLRIYRWRKHGFWQMPTGEEETLRAILLLPLGGLCHQSFDKSFESLG